MHPVQVRKSEQRDQHLWKPSIWDGKIKFWEKFSRMDFTLQWFLFSSKNAQKKDPKFWEFWPFSGFWVDPDPKNRNFFKF